MKEEELKAIKEQNVELKAELLEVKQEELKAIKEQNMELKEQNLELKAELLEVKQMLVAMRPLLESSTKLH